MGGKLSLNPWLEIWVRPRETIRAIIQYNSSYLLMLLYWIYGSPVLLQMAQNMSLGDRFPLPAILIGVAALAIVAGAVGINVGAGLLYWTGRWIGGMGDFRGIRAAVAWSSVPSVVTLALWIIQFIVFGQRVLTWAFLETPFVGGELAVAFTLSIIQVVVTVWGIVILLKALGEAQKFSAWKALLNVVLPLVMIFIVFKLIAWLFVVLTSGAHG